MRKNEKRDKDAPCKIEKPKVKKKKPIDKLFFIPENHLKSHARGFFFSLPISKPKFNNKRHG
jgi:hypothetical protein